MTYLINQSGGCTASITKNRNRVKVYQDKSSKSQVKQNQVLVKIWINNKLISSSGIILKPGQRAYLERYIDKSEKFTFSTYEVEDSKEAKEAIAKNGFVKVEFYDEYVPFSIAYTGAGSLNPSWTTVTLVPSWTTQTVGSNSTITTGSSYYSQTGKNAVGSLFSNDILNEATLDSDSLKSIETGRVEGGKTSEQKLNTASGNFNTFPSNSAEVQILPASLKPAEISELRKYCGECGTRLKKSSWKFCPNCGAKF